MQHASRGHCSTRVHYGGVVQHLSRPFQQSMVGFKQDSLREETFPAKSLFGQLKTLLDG